MTGKNLLFKVLIISCTLIFAGYAEARVNCNGAGGSYDDGGDKAMIQGSSIETLIATGGWYYLKANAEIQEILAIVEGQDWVGLDIPGVRFHLENAILHMGNAGKTYETLVKTAEATPYNTAVIAKLAAFDYDRLLIEQDLDSIIYREVQGYLKAGNITGAFKRIKITIAEMNVLLNLLKTDVESGQIPHLEICRQLNEDLAWTSLFGSIVARIFSALD